jgi:formimidoylglutamate deiminase
MLLTADRIIYDGFAYRNVGIAVSGDGRISAIAPLSELGKPDLNLEGRVLLPGMVNAHSHAFQRLLRGRTQFAGPARDNFWTWREAMYNVANVIDEDALYVTCRQVFIEMMLQGVTSVGEFHYLHHQPDGTRYPDSNELALVVAAAARDVGLRVSIIHTVYLDGDFRKKPTERQRRFVDRSVDEACDRFDALVTKLLEYRDSRIAWGIAAHSIRAVTMEAVTSLKARLSHMPFHMHISEQPAEVE